MKHIVVYKTIIVIGALILSTNLAAQKPAIDLISSHQQYRHPEAIIDTGYAVRPLLREGFLTPTPPVHNQTLRDKTKKKQSRQIGPSFDSLFQKRDSRSSMQGKPTVKRSLFNRIYNPMKLLIYITAIK
jgi:hypothetical protein